MDRQTALLLMQERISNKNLRKHILAVEAVMARIAREFNEDGPSWALAGLLHDLDYEETVNSPERHALVTAEILSGRDIDPKVVDAIKAHADKKSRDTLMEKAIYCADPVTGFIVACALISPDKKLAVIDVEFCRKRIKEKRFAAGADRGRMAACSDLGLTMEKFLEISLEAMRSISDDLGL